MRCEVAAVRRCETLSVRYNGSMDPLPFFIVVALLIVVWRIMVRRGWIK